MAVHAGSGPSPEATIKTSSQRLEGLRGYLVDVALLAVLMTAAGGLRFWQVRHTEVSARDSIGFIRYAWRLQHQPWQEVIRSSEQHPGYPLVILAISQPLRQVLDWPEPLVMQFSAQLASVLAGVLLVIPMYYLGKELFQRSIAFWASLLFQCLPTSSRVLADGLSEATFFLFASFTFLLATRALRGNSVVRFALTGLVGGLAYLVRPEGAFIVAATGLVLLAMQATRQRRPYGALLACGVGLVLGWAPIGISFYRITGHLTTKPAGQKMWQSREAYDDTACAPVRGPDSSGNPFCSGPLLATWWTEPASQGDALARLGKIGLEIAKAFHYVAWLPALLGFWWDRKRLFQQPGLCVGIVVGFVIVMLLWRVAARFGYVSDRHVLLLVLGGCYWSVAAILVLGTRLAAWSVRHGHRGPFGLVARSSSWSGLMLVALIAAGMPKCLEPLHANRSGFREAGAWLAQHASPADEVKDPYCWTHYYAGRVFTEGLPLATPSDHTRTCYVVLEESGNEHARLPIVPEAKALAKKGMVVFEWFGHRKKEKCLVRVYAVPLGQRP
jgi:hypothetical protein